MKSASKVVRIVMLASLILGALSAVTGCTTGPAQTTTAQSKIDEVIKRGTLRVGLDYFEPWAFKDKDGNLVGFEVDVAKKLAEDMQVKVEFVPTAWDGIIPALLADKFDVIIGGMGSTPQRALKVNFSIPYEYSGVDVVVSKKALPNVKTLEDLNREDVVLAIHLGTTAEAVAARYAPKAQVHKFDSDEALLQDILNGNSQASFSSSPTPAFWVADYPDDLYRPFDKYLTSEPSAFVVRKGDLETINFFNTWITYNADFLKERADYWYGSRAWADLLPPK